MQACYEHLLAKQTSHTGEEHNYYVKIEEFEIERSKAKINSVLKEALEKEIITKEEFSAMDPSSKNPAKFYMNFKVHKPHQPLAALPPCPIIGGSGSLTENLGVYIEHHIKDIANKHETYLQDTPDFLRIINTINQGQNLPKKCNACDKRLHIRIHKHTTRGWNTVSPGSLR